MQKKKKKKKTEGRGGGSQPQALRPPTPPMDFSAMPTMMLAWRMSQMESTNRPCHNGDGNIFGDNEALDGLRCVRAWSRSRAVKAKHDRAPMRVVAVYKEHWSNELGAMDGKSWT